MAHVLVIVFVGLAPAFWATAATSCAGKNEACHLSGAKDSKVVSELAVEAADDEATKMSQVSLLQTKVSLSSSLAANTNVSLQGALLCSECVANGHEPDLCSCGYCGSFGYCSWSCGGSGSGVPCMTFPCADCVTNGHQPDSCDCGFCGSFGGCTWSCKSRGSKYPACIQPIPQPTPAPTAAPTSPPTVPPCPLCDPWPQLDAMGDGYKCTPDYDGNEPPDWSGNFPTLCECQCKAMEQNHPVFNYNAVTGDCETLAVCGEIWNRGMNAYLLPGTIWG